MTRLARIEAWIQALTTFQRIQAVAILTLTVNIPVALALRLAPAAPIH